MPEPRRTIAVVFVPVVMILPEVVTAVASPVRAKNVRQVVEIHVVSPAGSVVMTAARTRIAPAASRVTPRVPALAKLMRPGDVVRAGTKSRVTSRAAEVSAAPERTTS